MLIFDTIQIGNKLLQFRKIGAYPSGGGGGGGTFRQNIRRHRTRHREYENRNRSAHLRRA